MLQITISTNTTRKKITVDPNKTIAEVLLENNVSYGSTTIHLDGEPLDNLNVTFNDMGTEDGAFLTSIIKADNA